MSEVRTRLTDEISREPPRIIVRIRKSRLGAKFCKQLWKDREEEVRSRYRSQRIRIEAAPMDSSDNRQIVYSKYDRCEGAVRNGNPSDCSRRNGGRNDDCGDPTNMVSSRAAHYKKTIIEKHRRSPESLDIFSNRNGSDRKDFVEKEDFDCGGVKDDRFDDKQEGAGSNSTSTSSSTGTAQTFNPSGTDLNMPTENKRKIVVLENMMIASPATTTSLPDQSITKSPSPDQNKTAIGKHALPTALIPQQKYSRVAMPLNMNLPQNFDEKSDVEENLNPNYPNATNDDKAIKAKQPSGTVRRKMTIPVRRKSTVVDENQRKIDDFNKEVTPIQGIQEMDQASNTRHNGLDLLSSVCATRHVPQQEDSPYVIQLENGVSAVVPPRISSRITQKIVSPHKQSPHHNQFDTTEAHHKFVPHIDATNPAFRRSASWQSPTTRPADQFQLGYNRSISMPAQTGFHQSPMHHPNLMANISNEFNKNRNDGQEVPQNLWHQHMQLPRRHFDALKEVKMQQLNTVYHNISAQNQMYRGMYHPAYYQPHMVVPNAQMENNREDLLANEIFNQQMAAQIRNQQIHQISEANRQNIYQAMYNHLGNIQPNLAPPNAPAQIDFNRRQLPLNKQKSPPPYNTKHFVVNRPKIPKEVKTESQTSFKPDSNQQESNAGLKQIKNIYLNNDKDNRNKSTNRLRQEFLDKIYMYQKYLTIQEFTDVLPKIPYSRDFSVYPYIVQEIEKIISSLPQSQSNNVTAQAQNSDQPSTFPLNPELVEKLLQNEATDKDQSENKSVKPEDKTSPNTEIDSQNQVCTLYYESQDDKTQADCTKEAVIIAEESPKQNKPENLSLPDSLLKNGQNYTTLLKLIDLVASTEQDRLLGQALLRNYPEEVLQVTMARIGDKLSTFANRLRAVEAKRRNDKNLSSDKVHEIIKPTSQDQSMPEIQEILPKTFRNDEPNPKTGSSTDKSIPKLVDVTAGLKPKVPQILPKIGEELPKISKEVKPKTDGAKLDNSNTKIIEISAQKPKSIPLSVIIQNPAVTACTNKKSPGFSHRIENIVSPSPNNNLNLEQKDLDQTTTILKEQNNTETVVNPENSVGNVRKGVIVKLEPNHQPNQKTPDVTTPPINNINNKPSIIAKKSLEISEDTECMMEAKELEVLLKATSPTILNKNEIVEATNENIICDEDSSEDKIFERIEILLREKPDESNNDNLMITKNESNSLEDSPIQTDLNQTLHNYPPIPFRTITEETPVSPAQHDIRLIQEASETSFQTIQTSSSSDVDSCNSIPSISHPETNTETDSTDDEPKEPEIKREYMQYDSKHLSHNFLFDVKFGPEDDIESIYARIMPSCFMILNLIHEMQNMNNINWWPVDTVGNLMKIKRSLRGIGIFLKRSKKIAAYLNPGIHHFFIFLLQCFGTFRERVKRILDNGFAMKENYISASEGDIYRDVFIQLYDYLCCNRVTEYANFIIKRDDSVNRKNKSDQNQSNQLNSFQPIKSFSSVHQKHMLIIEQLKQRRTAEEEKNEDFKNFISHLGSSNRMSGDDQNNNTQLDDVIIIPDAEDSNADSNPRENFKRKIELIIIDSDSEGDAEIKKQKTSNGKNTSYNIADIINLIDEDDLSNDTAKLEGNRPPNNKRESVEDYTEMHKKFCGDTNVEMPLKCQNEEIKNTEMHLHLDTKLEGDIKNEAETGECAEKIEPYEEGGKPNDIIAKTDFQQNEIKGENKDLIAVVSQSNQIETRNKLENEESGGKEDNLVKMEAQNKEAESQKTAAKNPSDRVENAHLDNSETIEAIQNYLRETDSIAHENSTPKDSSFEGTKSASPMYSTDKSLFNPSKHSSNENKVVGVAIPNVKDVTNPGIAGDSIENSFSADGYISDQNDNDTIENKKRIIKEIYRHQLTKQKDNKSTTQKLIQFRKPSKRIENKHSDEAPAEAHQEDAQNCSILEKIHDRSVPDEKMTNESRRLSQDIPAKIEQLNIPNESLNNVARRISVDGSPIQLKTRRISLDVPKNGSPTKQQYKHTNGLDNSDSFNIQAKAAISEYFDAQRIVARQIAAPIHPDIAVRNLENNSKSTTMVTGSKDTNKHKQIQNDVPNLQPTPTNSKELLRQAVIKRHLSNSQNSIQPLPPANNQKPPRSLPTPIPTLQSIYNDEINTNGFISQYIKDEIGVLSKKESLGPGEYVLEVNTLKRLPLIPKDFKEFYIFVTKQQILQLHQPITFYIFLELLNQSGLKDYHKKFTEYTKRKYEDRLGFKKREQSRYQQQQLRHNT